MININKMKYIFLIFSFLGISLNSISQKKSIFMSYPDSSDLKIFRNILLSKKTNSFSPVKIDFVKGGKKYFIVTNLMYFFDYYNKKYRRKFSYSNSDNLKLLKLIETPAPLADTIYFSSVVGLRFTVFKLYPDSVLNTYRKQGLQSLFEDYVDDNTCFCTAWPPKLIAYLFEKKIIMDDGHLIYRDLLDNIENKYRFKWDAKKYEWHTY